MINFWGECYDESGTIIPELAWAQVRRLRTELLAQCDWTDLPHAPLSESEKQAWQTYRQSLRDITLQPELLNLQWPAPP